MSKKKVEKKDFNYHAKGFCAAVLIGAVGGGVSYASKEFLKFCKNKINDFFDI